MTEPNISDSPRLMIELVESIQQASGACSQLLHHLQNPGFIPMREALDLTKEGVAKVARFQSAALLVGAPK